MIAVLGAGWITVSSWTDLTRLMPSIVSAYEFLMLGAGLVIHVGLNHKMMGIAIMPATAPILWLTFPQPIGSELALVVLKGSIGAGLVWGLQWTADRWMARQAP